VVNPYGVQVACAILCEHWEQRLRIADEIAGQLVVVEGQQASGVGNADDEGQAVAGLALHETEELASVLVDERHAVVRAVHAVVGVVPCNDAVVDAVRRQVHRVVSVSG
jgi:hypothetical protein